MLPNFLFSVLDDELIADMNNLMSGLLRWKGLFLLCLVLACIAIIIARSYKLEKDDLSTEAANVAKVITPLVNSNEVLYLDLAQADYAIYPYLIYSLAPQRVLLAKRGIRFPCLRIRRLSAPLASDSNYISSWQYRGKYYSYQLLYQQ